VGVLALGSTARREFTLGSDQENALAYDGEGPDFDAYFAALGEDVTRGLVRCGFELDPNDVVASNGLWRMPARRWSEVFRECLETPDRSHLIRANVAFDFRQIAGSLEVTPALVAVLREAKNHPDLLRQLARGATDFKPPLGFRGPAGIMFLVGVAVAGFTALGAAALAAQVPGVVYAFFATFAVVGALVALHGVRMARRRTAIAVVGPRLLVMQTGLVRSQKRTWEAGDLAAVRVGPSGIKVNEEDVPELQVVPRTGLKYGLLAGLGTAEGDHLRFSRAQVGLLDALLASQPEATCDAVFARARDELRRFAGIEAVDPPAGFVGGIEKLPELRSGIGWFGSAFYYPTASGNYTVTNPASFNFGKTYRQQYQILKYDVGLALVLARFPVYLYGGFNGDRYTAKQNAPIDQTHAGPYIGLGVKF